MNKRILLNSATSAIAVCFGSHAAFAQSEAASVEYNSGEIIVTAQKREQSINNVGMTIQAASAQTLENRGITDAADLNKLVPGFTATQSLYSTPVYTLRGIGLYDASFGSAPAVAIYTDQIARNFPVMSDGLELDIERIEVLKGPQGTLFGQSATGGAVNYIVAKPTDSLTAGFDASYERFDKVSVGGFVSGPLGDTLKARLAVRAINGGDWQYSLSRPGDKNGATRKLMGRLSLEWEPADTFRLGVTLTGVRDRSDTQAPQFAGTLFNTYSADALAAANASSSTANPYGVVDDALYAGITTPGSPNYDSTFLGRQATVVGRMNDTNPANASSAAGALAMLSTPDVNGRARAAEWTPGLLGPSRNRYFQGIVRADYDISDTITVTSITAFAHKKLKYAVDNDATVAEINDIPFDGSVRAFNQELRISGDTDNLHWIIGGNYDNSKTIQNNFFFLDDYSANTAIPGLEITDGANDFSSKLKTIAFFANAEYSITHNLSIVGGARYTENKQSASYCYNDPAADSVQALADTFSILQNLFTGSTLPDINPGECFVLGDGFDGTTFGKATISPLVKRQKEDNISFRAGLNYKFDQGTLLYATIAQGYKAGVFSAIGASSTSQYAPAIQEKVISYEGGFKAPLANGRLQLNGSAFYYDYTNKQIRAKILSSIFGLLDKMVNVPKSYVWGLEGEILARPVDGLVLSASGTYLKSKVTSDFTATVDGSQIYNAEQYTGNFRGAGLPFTPKFSGNVDVQYEWEMSGVKPFIGGTVLYQGSSNATFQNSVLLAPNYVLPEYTTVDLRAGISGAADSWRFTVFGRNIFNESYTTSASTFLDTIFRMTGRPAVYGVSFKYRYN